MRLRSLAFLLGMLLASLPARAEEWSFTTLEWPPFSGSLPGGGAMTTVLRAAFATQGDTLTIAILPWKRAVSTGMQAENGHVGFFTATPTECAAAGGLLSELPIGHFRYALAERQTSRVTWQTAADLQKLMIGIVDGYDNGALIDGLRGQGLLKVEMAASDLANLRKLQAGRIDAAVVEISQFAFYKTELDRNNQAKGLAPLALNPRPLGPPEPLHACFNNSDRGKRARLSLTRGLQRIDRGKLADQYLENLGQDAAASN